MGAFLAKRRAASAVKSLTLSGTGKAQELGEKPDKPGEVCGAR